MTRVLAAGIDGSWWIMINQLHSATIEGRIRWRAEHEMACFDHLVGLLQTHGYTLVIPPDISYYTHRTAAQLVREQLGNHFEVVVIE